jgi:hypothetical protein
MIFLLQDDYSKQQFMVVTSVAVSFAPLPQVRLFLGADGNDILCC